MTFRAFLVPSTLVSLTILAAMGRAASVAHAQDPRDAEIFGSPEAAPASPTRLVTPTPQQGNTAPAPTEGTPRAVATPAPPSVTSPSAIDARLADALAVGGRLEWRGNTGREEHQKLPAASFEQLKQADVYFDARPSEDIRAFLRLRLSEETRPTQTRAAVDPSVVQCVRCVRTELDELWLKWDFENAAFFTAGKQHLKWGSGRFFNPTDFTALETRDPFALFDRRLGQTLVKLHVPVESRGDNYYLVAQFDNVERNDDVGAALRGEWAFLGSGEFALSAQARRKRPVRLGADVSTALGPVDVHVETAVGRGYRQRFYRGDLEPEDGRVPVPYRARTRWFTQSVGGVEKTFKYSDEDNVTFGVEYFFNELGYDDRGRSLYALVLGDSKPLASGRHYGGAYLRVPTPGSWNRTSFFLNSLHNVSDQSNVSRATATYTLLGQATIEGYVAQCFGVMGELCFSAPSEIVALASNPAVPEEQRRALGALPKRKTRTSAGLGISMAF